MSRIVIEVDNQVANAFLNESLDKKERIISTINTYLKKVFQVKDMTEYRLLLDQISDEAENNGITEEKLKDLLDADD
jgi:bacterioferritin (cytochrome b1)